MRAKGPEQTTLGALFGARGQVHMHQRLEVAVEYGLLLPFKRLFSPYFTATHNWCKECPRVLAGKERPQVPLKYRLSEKKYRSPFAMVVLLWACLE